MVLARGRLVQFLQRLHWMNGGQGFEERLLLFGAPQWQDDEPLRVHLHWGTNGM